MPYMGMHQGFFRFGWLFQLTILLIFFVIVYWLVKSSNFGYHTSKHESALDILKKRLARGEIDKKEFDSLKKEIGE